ncbi:MAG: hypothetical protein LH628_11390 [Microcoleus sp. CAN_BIN18]|nr:hypothetical protein [Microcoleus sp. CAN_BIN18]
MHVHEVLQFVEKAVYAKTGKRLNDLQRAIIEGTLKRQKYDDIAENCGCSAGHAKDVGYELLQMLSDVFDEPVDKGNLKSVLERQGNLNISFGDRSKSMINNHNIIGCINMGSEQPTTTQNKSQSENPEFQRVKNKARIEAVGKLRQFGLSDEQIAEVLELPLDVVKQVDFQE